jgi:hypothetical protein
VTFSADCPTLASLVRTILDEPDPGTLKGACDRLHVRLAHLAGLPLDAPASDEVEPRRLANGTAIAPRDAARCLLDFARTAAFMRGVRAAVADARRRFPRTTVEVLYAGCGPYAPLTLPLVMERPPDEVRLTLIDAHERSLCAARRLYEQVGGLAHVRDFVHADAAAYTCDARWPPHVVVCEAMQQALTREPQVAITRQLAPQLVAGGTLVPERVTVEACLADLAKEFTLGAAPPAPRDRLALGTLMVVSKEPGDPFQPVVVDVPDGTPSLVLMLRTVVHVHAALVLDDYDSGITFPLLIPRPAGARRIEFRYRGGEEPRWLHRPLSGVC